MPNFAQLKSAHPHPSLLKEDGQRLSVPSCFFHIFFAISFLTLILLTTLSFPPKMLSESLSPTSSLINLLNQLKLLLFFFLLVFLFLGRCLSCVARVQSETSCPFQTFRFIYSHLYANWRIEKQKERETDDFRSGEHTQRERYKSWLGFVLVITRSSLKLMAAFTVLREDRGERDAKPFRNV